MNHHDGSDGWRSRWGARLVILAVLSGWTSIAFPSGDAVPDLWSLELGAVRTEVEQLFEGQTLVPYGPKVLLLETPIFPDLFQSQRTFLLFDRNDALKSIHLRILPDAGSRGREVLRLWEEIKSSLLRRLGRPAWERSEGRVHSGDLLAALGSGEVIRVAQWQGPPAVRAGIPARVDGALAVEILVTEDPPPRSDPYWGAGSRF